MVYFRKFLNLGKVPPWLSRRSVFISLTEFTRLFPKILSEVLDAPVFNHHSYAREILSRDSKGRDQTIVD
jgi:hypothetical protein